MKKIKSSVIAMLGLAVLSTACVQDVGQALHLKSKDKKKSNKVTNSKDTNEIISNEGIDVQVISETQLKQAALNKSLTFLSNAKVKSLLADLPQGETAESLNRPEIATAEESLLVGFPIGLIGEQNVFGGVITKVTDSKSELLGGLKLTDLSPIHSRTVVGSNPKSPFGIGINLVGCFSKCDENSDVEPFISFPIMAINESTGMVILDLSAIGQELDLISMLDPQGEYTQLKAISSNTTSVEFDMKTLIFDIKTSMIPVTAEPTDASVKKTEFTVRWYLKLNSGSNPAFESRTATSEVGYFKTERSKATKITRFSIAPINGKSQLADGTIKTNPVVKYYIKNVPNEYKAFFENALKSWNTELVKIAGFEVLSWEFVAPEDNDNFIPGDIRYNIIEWDKENLASYGGLGPSIANQFTGETMSANVLIQGPKIVELYSQWFGVSQEVNSLKEQGKLAEAAKLMKEFNVRVSSEQARLAAPKFEVKLGKHLVMNVRSQQEHLEDPISPEKNFEVVPAGVTYMQYMEGYFGEMLAHELGHNLGLRHNFKGNLGAIDNANEHGSVSRSIMEYLGRGFRHLNGIGPYDRMAISYGYRGKAPTHNNWFCTDEDQGSDAKTLAVKSPECSKADATSDPFSYWESRMARAIDLLVETKSNAAPNWTLKEIEAQVDEAVIGLTSYALSAEATAQTWTNFFGKNDRPEDKKEVKNYVLSKIKKKLCNPKLAEIIASKESVEAREAAQANLVALNERVSKKTVELGIFTASDLGCGE